jgi:hypothetical protein
VQNSGPKRISLLKESLTYGPEGIALLLTVIKAAKVAVQLKINPKEVIIAMIGWRERKKQEYRKMKETEAYSRPCSKKRYSLATLSYFWVESHLLQTQREYQIFSLRMMKETLQYFIFKTTPKIAFVIEK